MSFAARRFWSRLAAALDDGRRVLLAVVAESSVHSPGTAGAKMFVAEGGERVGTIGGGVMELRVLERADELLEAGEPGGWARRAEMVHRRRLEDEVSDQAAEHSGMICAGRQSNLYVLLRPEADSATAAELVQRLERGDGWWGLDSSGGFRVGKSPLAPQPRTLTRTDTSWTYTESLLERRRLAILGGGHCGQALARLMAGAGWHVAVWETRFKVVEDADLDCVADVHLVDDFRDAAPQIDLPRLTPVVVMTTDVPNDVRALFGALSEYRSFPFVGAMGSAAKLDEIRRRLVELGVSDEAMSKMTAPVGLEIDSHTPPEIAVSVAAQLLRLRHRWLETDPAAEATPKG